MPKSHHSRGKRTARSKPRPVLPVTPVSTVPAQALSQAPVAASLASPKPVTSLKSAVPLKALPPAYPYLMSDLKRIGILTGIIVVVLVVLYFVLT